MIPLVEVHQLHIPNLPRERLVVTRMLKGLLLLFVKSCVVQMWKLFQCVMSKRSSTHRSNALLVTIYVLQN